MSDRPMAVLGGGNGAQCMAADLSLAGYPVILCEHPDFEDGFAPILESGEIGLSGIGRAGTARLEAATTDLAATLEAAALLNLVVPANGHEAFFRAMLPHLREGHTLVVWAGDFGALRFRRLLAEHRPEVDVTVCETHTIPYGARLEGPGRVRLLLEAPEVLIAALPTEDPRAVEGGPRLLGEAFPCLRPARSVFETALNNPNPIVHPAASLLNVGWIQSAQDFHLYREGMTEAVARTIRAVFEEFSRVAGALGVEMLAYEERDFRSTASIMGVAFQAPFDTVGVIAGIPGPHRIEDRYITEDLPFGLMPVVELARKLAVETPVTRSLVEIGGRVCDRDFWDEGRGLEELGLGGMECDAMLEYVETGHVGS